jgi:hypothetical protein
VGLEVSVYGTNNALLARVTEGTEEEPNVIQSGSYNLLGNGNNYGSFDILVTNGQIEYSIFKNSSDAKRVEVKIKKIVLSD